MIRIDLENRLSRIKLAALPGTALATFLIPLIYAAVLSYSLSDEWFWSDDLNQLAFVRYAPSIWTLFGHDSFHLFRPVKNLIFLGFLHLEPLGVKWCRLLGMAIGVLSFFPVLSLFQRIFGSKWKAIASAAVWLLSPTLVSSVAWLSCLNIQIMAVFAALAIVNHDAGWDNDSFHPGRIALAALFLFFALTSYECAIAVVPLLFLFDVLLRPGRIRTRSARGAHTLYWMIMALYLVLRFLAGTKGDMSGGWAQATKGQLIVSAPYFTTLHFMNWFWPFGRFTVLGGYTWGSVPFAILAGCGLLAIGVFALALLMWRTRPVLSFCVFFAGIGFAPVGNWFGFGNGPYGDYYLTLASVGIAAGCVEAADFFLHVRGGWRGPALAVIVFFVAIRAAAVFEAAHWATLWSDGALAFDASIRHYPSVRSNHDAVTALLRQEDNYEKALEMANRIAETGVTNSAMMANIHLARAIHAINVEQNAEVAMEFIDKATEADVRGLLATLCHFYRGCVFEDVRFDMETAEHEYELALAGGWSPEVVPCADRLARIKAIRGERDNAIELWERAIQVDPNNETALWNLSIAYRKEGNVARSDELRAQAVVLMKKKGKQQ